MRYDYKYRINNKDKGDLAMELKELTSAEQVVMKCIWDYGKDMPLQQLIENLKQDYGKDYKRTTIRTFVLHLEEKGYVTTYQIGKYSYINYLIEEQDYKEQELEKTKNFWYKESGFDLVKTLYKGKLNEGKLKKLKKLLDCLLYTSPSPRDQA